MEIVEIKTFQAMPYNPSFKVKLKIPVYRLAEKFGRANSIIFVAKLKNY